MTRLDSTGEETTLHLPRHEYRDVKYDICESVDGEYDNGDSSVFLSQITIANENFVKAYGL